MARALGNGIEKGEHAVNNDARVAVDVCALVKVFGSGEAQFEALRGIDLQITRGEFVSVMGPSGSGKSTLLHLIGGLDAPTSGAIHVGGDDLRKLNDDQLTLLRRRRISFIFQAFNLIDVLTAQENVSLPLVIDGVSEAESSRRAMAALELVGMAHRCRQLPSRLSGGEQQRLAIARALVTQPLLVLADEPTGNLDSDTSDQMMSLLRNLVDQHRQTILMVTHDARLAALADRLLRLCDGRIVEEQILPRGRSVRAVLADLESIS